MTFMNLKSWSPVSVFKKKRNSRDLPGGPVVKNPPSNAGEMGSILGQGTKIPHALRLKKKGKTEAIL